MGLFSILKVKGLLMNWGLVIGFREMDKQIKQGNFPIRLVLSEKAGENLKFHVKHYTQRGLMRTVSGKELVEEMGCSEDIVKQQLDTYNKAASGAIKDPFGKIFPSYTF